MSGLVANRAQAKSIAGVLLTLAVSAALLTACGGRYVGLPRGPSEKTVVMKEYRFVNSKEVRRGRVLFRVRNAGRLYHRLSLVILPPDFPPITDQASGGVRRSVSTLASILDRRPGGTASLAVDLAPGRYGFLCYVIDEDGVSHAGKGMVSEFRVN